jgi:hypothetical protein
MSYMKNLVTPDEAPRSIHFNDKEKLEYLWSRFIAASNDFWEEWTKQQKAKTASLDDQPF